MEHPDDQKEPDALERPGRLEPDAAIRAVQRLVTDGLKPIWRTATDPESRWAASAAVMVAIALQFSLPLQYTIHPFWAISALEIAVLVGLLIVDPRRRDGALRVIRPLSIVLVASLTLTNSWSAVRLIIGLVEGTATAKPVQLLATGGAIWATNMIAFALWYWEFDSGGPAVRSTGSVGHPDFLFAQMQTPEVAPKGWKPEFVDYLYLSFTNGAAFSPTDVLPLTPRAKLTMMVQSIVSLVTVVLVVARAVNILA